MNNNKYTMEATLDAGKYQQVYVFTVDTSYASLTSISLDIAMFILGLISTIIIVGVARTVPLKIENFLFAVAPVGLILLTFTRTKRFNSQTRLEISPKGLMYHTPGLTITTDWSNVREVREEFGQAYLVLDEGYSSEMSLSTAFVHNTSSAAWNIDKRVPLHYFAVWTSKSLLYQKIHDFAPHVSVNRRTMRGY